MNEVQAVSSTENLKNFEGGGASLREVSVPWSGFLTDIELLAVLLRTGTHGENAIALAKKILYPIFSQEGLLNIHQWSLEQLFTDPGESAR